jgi:hypothetical protein
VDADGLLQSLRQLRDATRAYDIPAISTLLHGAVPEFVPIAIQAREATSSTVVAFPTRSTRKN